MATLLSYHPIPAAAAGHPKQPHGRLHCSDPGGSHLGYALSNDLLRSLSRHGEAVRALMVYSRMRSEGSAVAPFSFPAVLSAAAKVGAAEEGREVHGFGLKMGLGSDPFVATGLVKMYSGCGRVGDARLVFDKMPHRDVVTWAIMLDGYSQNGLFNDVFELYEEMKNSDTKPDRVILSTVLSACGRAGNLSTGEAIHHIIVSNNLCTDSRLVSALITMYASCGSMEAARELFDRISPRNLVVSTAMISGYSKLGQLENARSIFDQMTEKDLIAWSAMISGYAESDKPQESLRLFDDMQSLGLRPDKITMLSVISACAHLGALGKAKWVHGYVDRNRFDRDLAVNNAMIDMYAKCGSLERAREVFEKMQTKNVISWTSMISACAIHGEALTALSLFDQMKRERIEPNGITFVGMLYACSHAGLVEEGQRVFASMVEEHRIAPKQEHYGLMVDLFGRANRLREALEIVETMPFAPNVVIWGSLMSACVTHGEAELGEFAAERLLAIDPSHDGALIALSNMYARDKKWESVARIRSAMKRSGVSKEKGSSRIESNGEVRDFLMEDRNHEEADEIYENLEKMVKDLRLVGYAPSTEAVLVDLDEEEKEAKVLWHSEKLALSYGLISGVKDSIIRVVKNLRICQDCHTFMKLSSKVYGREIVVRDRTRFHHFKDGVCSCKDYW